MCEFGYWPPYGVTARWMDRPTPDQRWIAPQPEKRPRKITERFDKDGNLIERVTEDLEFDD
jgi:hypothetical protein